MLAQVDTENFWHDFEKGLMKTTEIIASGLAQSDAENISDADRKIEGKSLWELYETYGKEAQATGSFEDDQGLEAQILPILPILAQVECKDCLVEGMRWCC